MSALLRATFTVTTAVAICVFGAVPLTAGCGDNGSLAMPLADGASQADVVGVDRASSFDGSVTRDNGSSRPDHPETSDGGFTLDVPSNCTNSMDCQADEVCVEEPELPLQGACPKSSFRPDDPPSPTSLAQVSGPRAGSLP